MHNDDLDSSHSVAHVFLSKFLRSGALLLTWINFNPSMDLSNHVPSKERNDKQFHPTLCNRRNYLSLLGLKLIHVSKCSPRYMYLRNCRRDLVEAVNISKKYYYTK